MTRIRRSTELSYAQSATRIRLWNTPSADTTYLPTYLCISFGRTHGYHFGPVWFADVVQRQGIGHLPAGLYQRVRYVQLVGVWIWGSKVLAAKHHGVLTVSPPYDSSCGLQRDSKISIKRGLLN
jgi:hypothetical protein